MQVVQLNALSETKIIAPSGKRTTAKKWYEDLKLTLSQPLCFTRRESYQERCFF